MKCIAHIFLIGLGIFASLNAQAVNINQGQTSTFKITINGTVTQSAKCSLTALANQTVIIPDAVFANIKTNEEVDALFPFMTLSNPKLPQNTANNLSTTLNSFAGYKESQPFSLSCDLTANNLISFKVGDLAGGNLGLFGNPVQSDLMLNFSLPAGQNLTDYQQVFRVATFLIVESNGVKDAYRLDLAKSSADPMNASNITSKIKVAPNSTSNFKIGFLLTRRSRDYNTNWVFNWVPPDSEVSYNATLPLVISFN